MKNGNFLFGVAAGLLVAAALLFLSPHGVIAQTDKSKVTLTINASMTNTILPTSQVMMPTDYSVWNATTVGFFQDLARAAKGQAVSDYNGSVIVAVGSQNPGLTAVLNKYKVNVVLPDGTQIFP